MGRKLRLLISLYLIDNLEFFVMFSAVSINSSLSLKHTLILIIISIIDKKNEKPSLNAILLLFKSVNAVGKLQLSSIYSYSMLIS